MLDMGILISLGINKLAQLYSTWQAAPLQQDTEGEVTWHDGHREGEVTCHDGKDMAGRGPGTGHLGAALVWPWAHIDISSRMSEVWISTRHTSFLSHLHIFYLRIFPSLSSPLHFLPTPLHHCPLYSLPVFSFTLLSSSPSLSSPLLFSQARVL